jgi:hypothetical protein
MNKLASENERSGAVSPTINSWLLTLEGNMPAKWAKSASS